MFFAQGACLSATSEQMFQFEECVMGPQLVQYGMWLGLPEKSSFHSLPCLVFLLLSDY